MKGESQKLIDEFIVAYLLRFALVLVVVDGLLGFVVLLRYLNG